MNRSIRFSCLTAFVLTLVIAGITGCAEVRKLTYSKDFTYVEDKEVRNLMRKMSKGVERLGQVVESSTVTEPARQQKIISEINELESIAAKLSAGHTQTNQLFISDHIEQFSSDISTAKMLVKASPPDYSRISVIVGNCQQCHKLR